MAQRYVRFGWVGLLALLLLGATSLALAQGAGPQNGDAIQAPLSTAFTYQGRLISATTPVSGVCDFTFTLYDAASGGSALGVENQAGVPVDDGYFTTQLDFGASAFEGEARYLEIDVSCDGDATTLAPRQQLTPAPYALYARDAGSARALRGLAVAGTIPTTGQVLKWDGSQWAPSADDVGTGGAGGDITAVTAGTGLLGGGITDAVTLSVDFAGSGSATTVARSDHDHNDRYQARYVRTVIVGPVGDGSDQQANGAALLAALDTITDASRTNPYLLKIEPGIYDVITTPVAMTAYVDVEGSGIGATEIRSSGFYTFQKATVLGADNAEIRKLTVSSQANRQDPVAVGIYSDRRIDFRMRDLRVEAYDALSYTYGIQIIYGGATLKNVSVEATVDSGSGVSCAGIVNDGGLVRMNDVDVASYDGNLNFGIAHANTSTAPEMTDVKVTVVGGSSARGINNSDASPEMYDVRIEVSFANYGYGIYNGGTSSAPILRDVTVTSSGSSIWDYGLYNADGSATVKIDRSTLAGDTYSIRNGPQASSTLLVGASHLDGSINNSGGGSFTCAASYDGNYAALDATCQ